MFSNRKLSVLCKEDSKNSRNFWDILYLCYVIRHFVYLFHFDLESVELAQVCSDSPPLQPCFVCQGANCAYEPINSPYLKLCFAKTINYDFLSFCLGGSHGIN